MLRTLVVAALAALTLTSTTTSGAAVAAEPTHSLSVSGTGVGMYPSYDSSVRRYAATTTNDTFPSNASDDVSNQGATVTVSATTSDPGGSVLVDGVPMTGDQVTLSDVAAGQEISVIFVDSSGREADSVYVLPAGFPTLTATVKEPGITAGLVGLTLLQFNTDWPAFSAFVDQNGVPAWTQASHSLPLDLKRQPNGSYSVTRNTTTPGRTGAQIVQMDSKFHETAHFETAGDLTNTDNHDSILEADGSRVLLGYEPNPDTGKTDSVIQEVDPDGNVVFQWDSAALADETVLPTNLDYAHINSVRIINGGEDFLASFRNLSAVLEIARQPHDGFAPGDIVWKLGGRDSTFGFVDDPYSGPCGQHTASQLPDGDIMVFDDGSGPLGGPLCVDPSDPTGAAVSRTQSRVAIWHLDESARTATLVRSFTPVDWYSWFMGSTQYLPATQHVLVGWAAATQAVASEITPDGSSGYRPIWQLVAAPSSNNVTYISYRAQKFEVPDAQAPQVTVATPAAGASYEIGHQVTTDFSCTDAGGSTLQTCGPALPGGLLDTTTPGKHTYRVSATDGAGNITRVTRHYTVGPVVHRPDVMVKSPDGSWTGTKVYGAPASQTTTWPLPPGGKARITFGLANRGNYVDRCLVRGTQATKTIEVSYSFGGRDVTRAVVKGTWRTPATAVGGTQRLQARVHVVKRAPEGTSRALSVRCVSPDGGPKDTARARVTVG